MLALRLFLPNPKEEFSWFMCGGVYEQKNVMYIDVAPQATFFSSKDGKNFHVLKGTKLARGKITLQEAITLGYDGVIQEPSVCVGEKDLCSCLLKNSVFVVKKEKLVPITAECSLVAYAKRHNSMLRNKVPNFPTCSEIDALTKEYGCNKVGLGLYRMMKDLGL